MSTPLMMGGEKLGGLLDAAVTWPCVTLPLHFIYFCFIVCVCVFTN